MGTTNVQTLTGNRVVLKFDGVEVGLIQSARQDDSYGLEPVSGIGDIHVQEYCPTKADHTINISSIALLKNSLMSLGLLTENGDAALQGKVYDIVVYSKDTAKTIRATRKCSMDSCSLDLTKHVPVARNCVFKALDTDGTGA